MQVWNMLHAARWKYKMQKVPKNLPSWHHRTTLSGYIFATKTCIDNRKKNLLSSNMSSTCLHNMVNFGPLATEIGPVVWGTPANFNGFCVLSALLHVTPVLVVSQTLRCWTEGATYIRQGGYHVGHWPIFLFFIFFCHSCIACNNDSVVNQLSESTPVSSACCHVHNKYSLLYL